jgi:sugar lactone lactonase YvrE
MTLDVHALPLPPCGLGESPFWHPEQGALYWVDIPGRALLRYVPAAGGHAGEHRHWDLPSEPGCIAPLAGGALLIAMRDGLFRFDPASGAREALARPPYNPAQERFNDGRADPQGRLWVGTIYEPRQPPRAALYRWADDRLERVAGDVTVSNGLAFSPDGRTMYWADTGAHRVDALDFDGADGSLSRRRPFALFATRDEAAAAGQSYGGRPDGAAVDAEGAYWVAMYEGGRLLRFAPDGALLQEVPLPARCPTMPCFGGADLRTLYVTTARANRPVDELAALPLSGQVLVLRVPVPGLPVNFAAG